MKVLIYGAGVIGGQLSHALCKAGNDVTIMARGQWAQTLKENGLQIHHYIQRKDTVDHPRVITGIGPEHYDIVFAVMQYKQMEQILMDLAKVNSPIVVLTGNNLSAKAMEEKIHNYSRNPKTVLFGFGSTAGTRENGKLNTVHTGEGMLTIGKAETEVSKEMKRIIKRTFKGSKVAISWCDNMDSWLKYHAAMILPIVYLCYKTNCDLRKSTRNERKLMLEAIKDAYHLLMSLGYPVRPAGDEKTLEPGILNEGIELVFYLMSKTKIGALCTTEHCKHAPGEMKDLHDAFMKIRETNPDYPMPSFDSLYRMMPSWNTIFNKYK